MTRGFNATACSVMLTATVAVYCVLLAAVTAWAGYTGGIVLIYVTMAAILVALYRRWRLGRR